MHFFCIFAKLKLTKKIYNYLIAALLTLSILLPTVLQSAKFVILLFCLLFALGWLFDGEVKINFKSFIFSLFFVFVGVAWAFFGLLKNNPGALLTMTVMVVYPLLLPLLTYCYRSSDKESIRKFLISAGFFLAVFDIIFILGSIFQPDNFFSNFIFDINKDDAVIDDAADYFKFTLPNVASVIFLLPFIVANAIFYKSWRIISIIASLLLIFVIFASGRRAGLVTPVISLIFIYLISIFILKSSAPTRLDKKNIFPEILFGLTVILFWVYSEYYEYSFYYLDAISSIMDFTSDASNRERLNQFYALLNGFYDNPLFGAGAGAAANYSRSDTQPWAYELTYLALLFQYGIFGFLIYFIGVCYLLFKLIMGVRNLGFASLEYSYLVGFVSFLLANATNPYLGKFDSMWVLFLALAIVNGKNKNKYD